MHWFCVLNRRKAIKKTSSGLIGKLTTKKNKFYLRAFFKKISHIFFVLSSQLENSYFTYRGSVNQKPRLQSNEAQ